MCIDPFIGTIMTTAIKFAPKGWKMCDGTTLSINQYEALFSLIGNIYGGDGLNNFKLPDLRCRMPVGVGEDPAPILRKFTLGQADGRDNITLVAAQVPLPAHTHAATFAPTMGKETVDIPETKGDPALSVKVSASTATGTQQMPVAGSYLAGSSFTNAKIYAATATSPVELGGVVLSGKPDIPASKVSITTMTGGSVTNATTAQPAAMAVDLMNPCLALNFIIAMEGVYPPRS